MQYLQLRRMWFTLRPYGERLLIMFSALVLILNTLLHHTKRVCGSSNSSAPGSSLDKQISRATASRTLKVLLHHINLTATLFLFIIQKYKCVKGPKACKAENNKVNFNLMKFSIEGLLFKTSNKLTISVSLGGITSRRLVTISG